MIKTCETCAKNILKLCKTKKEKILLKGKSVCNSHIEKNSNCMNCRKFRICKNTKRSFGYVCKEFKKLPEIAILKLPKINDEPKTELDVLLDEILNNKFTSIPNFKLDDRDFKLAPNYFEWCIGKQYLNAEPMATQLEMGLNLFLDYCPHCSNTVWFKKVQPDATYDDFRENLVLLKHGVCPKCGKNRLDLVNEGYFRARYDEKAACCGQRSGKSFSIAFDCTYLTHQYLKLPDPAKTFGIAPGQIILGTFTSVSVGQATRDLWTPFYNYLNNSPWFSAYHAFLREHSSKHENLFKFPETFVLYNHKGIMLHPSAPDIRTLRGATRFFSSVDEIGWFDNKKDSSKVRLNAIEVYNALARSLKTIRSAASRRFKQGQYNIPTAYMDNISSPSSIKDKIMSLVLESAINPKLYAIHRPTWEMNPEMPKTELASEYNADPIGAERDYGANPPLSNKPFITEAHIKNAIGKHKPVAKLKYKTYSNKKGVRTVGAKLEIIRSNKQVPAILLFDAGLVNNQFACVLAHLEKNKMIVDFIGTIPPHAVYHINFNKVYTEVIDVALKNYKIIVTGADRWQSVSILSQISNEYHIDTPIYSLTYEDMVNTKQDLLEGNIKLPKLDFKLGKNFENIKDLGVKDIDELKTTPVAYAVLQMLTVQDTGRAVLKGEGFDDDMWRALSLANTLIRDPKYNFSNENSMNIGISSKVDNVVIGRTTSTRFKNIKSDAIYTASVGGRR